jgi:mono/diheme cytochrome c family protein
MRRAALRGLGLAALMLGSVPGCHCADGCGPLERGTRAAVGGWDMWSTPSVRPYETPMPPTVAGTVPTAGTPGYAPARAKVAALSVADRARLARMSYRRYCAHCHGAAGDGRSIVGESFDPAPPDLRAAAVQGIADEDLFDLVTGGSGKMPPLAAIATPEEAVLALDQVKRLAHAPSRPYFTPKYTAPIRQP